MVTSKKIFDPKQIEILTKSKDEREFVRLWLSQEEFKQVSISCLRNYWLRKNIILAEYRESLKPTPKDKTIIDICSPKETRTEQELLVLILNVLVKNMYELQEIREISTKKFEFTKKVMGSKGVD
jgi:hypothetical protein